MNKTTIDKENKFHWTKKFTSEIQKRSDELDNKKVKGQEWVDVQIKAKKIFLKVHIEQKLFSK